MTDDDAADFEWIQGCIATANTKTAQASKRATQLANPHHPSMTLADIHSELTSAYSELVQAINTVETTLDQLDDDYGDATPRQIKKEHATRLEEQYDGPVLYLALMLLESNRREWLHEKPDTNGAEEVRRHGLVENQRRFLNQLQDAWSEYDPDSEEDGE